MKNKLLTIFKVIISGFLLYLISQEIEWSQLISSIKQGELVYLLIGVILGYGFNVVKFIKWNYLINTGKQNYSFSDAVKSYMIGNCLGMITPLRAGDLARALYFANDQRPKIVGLTIIDRFIELVAVFILSVAGCFTLLNKGVGYLVIILSAASILFIYSAGVLHCKFNGIISGGRFGEKIMKLADVLKMLNTKVVSVILLLSLVAFIVCIFQFYYLINAFEGTSKISAFLVTPLITLSSILPISIMGLGVREGISIVLFSKFGVSASTALSAAFLFFLINNFSISVIGLFFLFKVKIKSNDVDYGFPVPGGKQNPKGFK